MPVKKKRSYSMNRPSEGKKLLPTIKKYGIFKGSGKYADKQTGIKAMQKVVPLSMMVIGLSAVSPRLGRALTRSVRTVPVLDVATQTLSQTGSMLRSRLRR